jgi:hypothetical protein
MLPYLVLSELWGGEGMKLWVLDVKYGCSLSATSPPRRDGAQRHLPTKRTLRQVCRSFVVQSQEG